MEYTLRYTDKVLARLELQQNIRLVMVHELDSVVLKVAGSVTGFFLQLMAVFFVRKAIADKAHLFDPILV